MKKVSIQSSNPNDTAADIEDFIEKAYTSVTKAREGKDFTDEFLKETKKQKTQIVEKILNNMVDEIIEELK